MTNQELIDERADLIIQLAAINAQILAIINSKTKKYEYSNIETRHVAENQSMEDLRKMKRDIKEQIANIDSQLGCYFVQIKNR